MLLAATIITLSAIVVTIQGESVTPVAIVDSCSNITLKCFGDYSCNFTQSQKPGKPKLCSKDEEATVVLEPGTSRSIKVDRRTAIEGSPANEHDAPSVKHIVDQTGSIKCTGKRPPTHKPPQADATAEAPIPYWSCTIEWFIIEGFTGSPAQLEAIGKELEASVQKINEEADKDLSILGKMTMFWFSPTLAPFRAFLNGVKAKGQQFTKWVGDAFSHVKFKVLGTKKEGEQGKKEGEGVTSAPDSGVTTVFGQSKEVEVMTSAPDSGTTVVDHFTQEPALARQRR